MPQVDLRSVAGQFGPGFAPVLRSADSFWRVRLSGLPARGEHILVELLTQDLRVSLRSLSLASSLSINTGARVIAVVGSEPQWEKRVWTGYDAAMLRDMARSWGAVDVVDLRVALPAVRDGATHLVVDGQKLPIAAELGIDPAHFASILDATGARIRGVPAMTDQLRGDDAHTALRQHSEISTRIWEALVEHTSPIAFVTSHVDYAQWAPASVAAGRVGVPTLHVQSTGGMKAYRGIDPASAQQSYRQALTLSLGTFFEEQLWPHRAALGPAAELVTWRSRRNLGTPSWWRSDSEDDEIAYVSAAERLVVREWAARRIGLPADRPVVAVFNHAVSDALGGNHENFDSLADWFERTAEYAARHPEVSWLLLDHPKQYLYDTTGSFERVAERFGHHRHLRFTQSKMLSKNQLWSLTDLVVTVRGSVSNEYPAYGTPAIQAGWSEWSHCGFTMRADDQPSYWRLLDTSLAALVSGAELITDEQVQRARLWMWFYRSGSDVDSGLVPHWRQGIAGQLHTQLNVAMNAVEGDADPLFTSVARWWKDAGPALLRAPVQDVAASVRIRPAVAGYHLLTSLDEPLGALGIGAEITTGADPRVALLKGWHRSWAMVARAWKSDASIGIRCSPQPGARLLAMTLQIDPTAAQWWAKEHPGQDADRVRTLAVHIGGKRRATAILDPHTATPDTTAAEVPAGGDQLPPSHEAVIQIRLTDADIGPSGFVVVDVLDDPASELPDAVIGVRIDVIAVGEDPGGRMRSLLRRSASR
ncbi:MAG: hypothetical protein M3Y49_03000 [Actinomycetota bacterium]|nr:hypothetical protein [Actinomycetota bacterium]